MISLIVCTLNRVQELTEFFDSLLCQNYKNFEVILMDQNADDRLLFIKGKYNTINVRHYKSNVKGLSVNRNLGINYAVGDILCFPDDDCIYSRDTLEKVNEFFESTKYDIFTCSVKDILSEKQFKMPICKCDLNKYNYHNKCISIGIFIRFKNKEDVRFDEKLGVGSFFGSNEESDLISSLLNIEYKGYYDGEYYVYHPLEYSLDIQRYYKYGLGYGALMRKEILLRRKIFFIFPFVFDILKRLFAICLPIKKRKYILYSLRGKFTGFILYK